VVFLGDRDQLASVEAGAVLVDICRCIETGGSPSRAAQLTALTGCTLTGDDVEAAPAVRDSICLLRQSYRFAEKSGIGQLARAVNQGDARQMRAIFAAGHQDVSFQPLNDGD
ncbi:exodeoxyribonuclease V subunit alpha, partial [Pantoea sp. SIMBA_133]